jgi:hypothetical protein
MGEVHGLTARLHGPRQAKSSNPPTHPPPANPPTHLWPAAARGAPPARCPPRAPSQCCGTWPSAAAAPWQRASSCPPPTCAPACPRLQTVCEQGVGVGMGFTPLAELHGSKACNALQCVIPESTGQFLSTAAHRWWPGAAPAGLASLCRQESRSWPAGRGRKKGQEERKEVKQSACGWQKWRTAGPCSPTCVTVLHTVHSPPRYCPASSAQPLIAAAVQYSTACRALTATPLSCALKACLADISRSAPLTAEREGSHTAVIGGGRGDQQARVDMTSSRAGLSACHLSTAAQALSRS